MDYLKEAIDAMKAADAALGAAENSGRYSAYMGIYESHIKNVELFIMLSIASDLRRIAEVLAGASEYGGANDALRISVLR